MNRVLVNLFDRHSQGSLLAIDKIKPDKIIYIIDKENSNLFKEIELCEKSIYKNIEFENHVINEENVLEIKSILKDLPVEDTIINVTGGKRIYSLVLLNEALNRGFDSIYVDVLNKRIYEFGCFIKNERFDFMDLSLNNMLKLTGTNLITDSTTLSEKNDIADITKKIYKNLDVWYKHKQKLYDNKIFIHDCYNANKLFVKLNNLNFEEKKLLNSCLIYLKEIKAIQYTEIDDEIEIYFLKDYVRSFIFKSGTWLEVLTNMIVRDISEIDEVKSGVIFLWKECNNKVRNELDVLAVKDSVFICISCKDSEKYDEDALNELEVYSKRLGGNTVKKILVATKLPCKQCVIERAKAMNISLIIVGKDINKFRNSIRNAILN
ncbi:DUF1887 family CARF protein [uncultured Clostridium sp.]|uniref:Card1-like endonuclease domain-containing protein n=1 Tax=uncultured Clostridium sp. TaxID=59620 RepID=UPI0025FB1C29|nr:DUF1887 family CARF protein [uncultured Clostridium sp.]